MFTTAPVVSGAFNEGQILGTAVLMPQQNPHPPVLQIILRVHVPLGPWGSRSVSRPTLGAHFNDAARHAKKEIAAPHATLRGHPAGCPAHMPACYSHVPPQAPVPEALRVRLR